VVVMPGAGIHAGNIASLAQATGASEFHASAKRSLPSGMRHRHAGLDAMATGEWRSDEAEVRAIVAALHGAHEATALP
jgi:copper homeostasis protein